jgi:hypothetical protein
MINSKETDVDVLAEFLQDMCQQTKPKTNSPCAWWVTPKVSPVYNPPLLESKEAYSGKDDAEHRCLCKAALR